MQAGSLLRMWPHKHTKPSQVFCTLCVLAHICNPAQGKGRGCRPRPDGRNKLLASGAWERLRMAERLVPVALRGGACGKGISGTRHRHQSRGTLPAQQSLSPGVQMLRAGFRALESGQVVGTTLLVESSRVIWARSSPLNPRGTARGDKKPGGTRKPPTFMVAESEDVGLTHKSSQCKTRGNL